MESPSPLRFLAALIPPCAQTECDRFTGVHILAHPGAAFGKVQGEFQHPWAVAFYALGILCASWHFSYGLWLFAAKWGIVTGSTAQRRLGYVVIAIGLLFVGVGAATMYSFLNTPLQPLELSGTSLALRH